MKHIAFKSLLSNLASDTVIEKQDDDKLYSYDLIVMTTHEFDSMMNIIKASTDKGTIERINNFFKHINHEQV